MQRLQSIVAAECKNEDNGLPTVISIRTYRVCNTSAQMRLWEMSRSRCPRNSDDLLWRGWSIQDRKCLQTESKAGKMTTEITETSREHDSFKRAKLKVNCQKQRPNIKTSRYLSKCRQNMKIIRGPCTHVAASREF